MSTSAYNDSYLHPSRSVGIPRFAIVNTVTWQSQTPWHAVSLACMSGSDEVFVPTLPPLMHARVKQSKEVQLRYAFNFSHNHNYSLYNC